MIQVEPQAILTNAPAYTSSHTISGLANVAEVPYMEGFICKPDVRTLSAMKSMRKLNFLLISSIRHISETKASIFVAFALKYSATYLFYDCV